MLYNKILKTQMRKISSIQSIEYINWFISTTIQIKKQIFLNSPWIPNIFIIRNFLYAHLVQYKFLEKEAIARRNINRIYMPVYGYLKPFKNTVNRMYDYKTSAAYKLILKKKKKNMWIIHHITQD